MKSILQRTNITYINILRLFAYFQKQFNKALFPNRCRLASTLPFGNQSYFLAVWTCASQTSHREKTSQELTDYMGRNHVVHASRHSILSASRPGRTEHGLTIVRKAKLLSKRKANLHSLKTLNPHLITKYAIFYNG